MNKRLERKDFNYSKVFDMAIESYREDTAKYLRQKKNTVCYKIMNLFLVLAFKNIIYFKNP